MSGCTVFVFMSLMEYALVNILMGDIVDGEESALKKGMKSMFLTSAGPNNRAGSTRMPTTTSQQVRANHIIAFFNKTVQGKGKRVWCKRLQRILLFSVGKCRICLVCVCCFFLSHFRLIDGFLPVQLMEVQPHCLLKNAATTPSASIQRSKSMMTSSTSCYKPQQTTRFMGENRQHHAVEIHHPDDGSGGLQSSQVTSPSSADSERRWERANNSTASSRQGTNM